VPADRSILDVAEQLGVPMTYSCSEGTCGSCETRILAGTADHRDAVLSPDERASGTVMMPCVSRSAGGRLVLDL
jgi:ferredoxin